MALSEVKLSNLSENAFSITVLIFGCHWSIYQKATPQSAYVRNILL